MDKPCARCGSPLRIRSSYRLPGVAQQVRYCECLSCRAKSKHLTPAGMIRRRSR